jgi:Cu(I)/Ag(I) efflux system membrane protein CusA/SilA
MFGLSFVYVIFDEGTDLYWARSRVLEYLSSVRGTLPDGAEPMLGPDATSVGWVFQYALVDESGQQDLQSLAGVPGLDAPLCARRAFPASPRSRASAGS